MYIYIQRDLEFILQQKHGIRVIRRTLLDLATTSKYAGNEYVYGGRELILPDDIDGIVSAAVVYYRAGYTPDDYPSLNEWIGRSIVEHSGAVKCPDIFYHIFGAKVCKSSHIFIFRTMVFLHLQTNKIIGIFPYNMNDKYVSY